MTQITIDRHTISSSIAIEMTLEDAMEQLPLYHNVLQDQPQEMLGTSMRELRDAALSSFGLGDDHDRDQDLLINLHAFAIANFRFGAGREPFNIEYDGQSYTLTPERKSDFMGVDDWKLALDVCLLRRDMDGLNFLSRLDESVFTKSNQGASAFDLAFFRFWAHFFTGGANTGPLLVDAVKLALEPQENKDRSRFVNLIRYPELRLLQSVVEGDAADFQVQLEKALIDHREYWKTKDLMHSPEGWISLPLSATCAMAVDAKQFPIEVESPYIPSWLYLGK